MEGHTLIIPRKHVGAIFELDPADLPELLETVLRFQKKMVSIFSGRWGKPAGCDVSWHTRPFMPTTQLSIPGHAHVHLRPRYFNDELYQQVQIHETELFQTMSLRERDEFQKLLTE